MIARVERIVAKLESSPMTLVAWLGAFAAVVGLRFFLEIFSSPSVDGSVLVTGPTLLHVGLFFLAAVFLSLVVASVVGGIELLPMTRAMVYLLPIMWLAPIIDMPFGGAHMAYLFSLTPGEAFVHFFQYFGPPSQTYEVTLGQRIELGLLVVLLGGYAYVHTKRLAVAARVAVAEYTLLYFLAIIPSIVAWFLPGDDYFGALPKAILARSFVYGVDINNSPFVLERLFDIAMVQLFFLMFVVVLAVWARHATPRFYWGVVKNLRAERMAHFIVMGVLGVLLAAASGARSSWIVFDFITIVVAIITMVCACVFAIVTNDLVDESIDRISNQDRPLSSGALSQEEMKQIGLTTGLLTAIGASTLGLHAFCWIGVFTAAYYVYSVPPLRLKRIPLLSSMCIGIASLAFFLLGFYLFMPTRALAAFPVSVGVLIVFFMTLITNVRDLKDIEGDRAAGIRTIPVRLGEARARQVMTAMTILAYALVPLTIPVTLLWIPSVAAAAVSAYCLLSGTGERPIFIIYFAYLLSVVIILANS